MARFTYLGFVANHTGSSDDTLDLNIKKAGTALVRIRPALRSTTISLRLRSKMVDTFLWPISRYSLSTIVIRLHDCNRSNAVSGMKCERQESD